MKYPVKQAKSSNFQVNHLKPNKFVNLLWARRTFFVEKQICLNTWRYFLFKMSENLHIKSSFKSLSAQNFVPLA